MKTGRNETQPERDGLKKSIASPGPPFDTVLIGNFASGSRYSHFVNASAPFAWHYKTEGFSAQPAETRAAPEGYLTLGSETVKDGSDIPRPWGIRVSRLLRPSHAAQYGSTLLRPTRAHSGRYTAGTSVHTPPTTVPLPPASTAVPAVSIHGLMRPSGTQSAVTAECDREDRWATGS